ncbi:MAG: hypothetical protein KAJ18_08665 [Candidatus Omnitrophica bacterium]|nr:hypothetical protein [Candidatus Omnitrophota bacterium]
MSTWPASLPQQHFLGVDIGDDETRLISPMDAGPASVRNRFTAFSQQINTPIVLTGAQLEIFRTFYRDTLNNGTNTFTWTDPVDDQSVTLRFKSPPRWKAVRSGIPAKRLWSSALALEILP